LIVFDEYLPHFYRKFHNRNNNEVYRKALATQAWDLRVIMSKGKGRVAPVHATEAYGGSTCIAPYVHNLGSRWR
jgi:hypothetical protein